MLDVDCMLFRCTAQHYLRNGVCGNTGLWRSSIQYYLANLAHL